MYGYLTTFLLIFMTHPGVMYTLMDPGIFSGAIHAGIVLLLQLPSEGQASSGRTVEILYWVAFGLWVYIKARMALIGGVTGALLRR